MFIFRARFHPSASEPRGCWPERIVTFNACLIPHLTPRLIPAPENDR